MPTITAIISWPNNCVKMKLYSLLERHLDKSITITYRRKRYDENNPNRNQPAGFPTTRNVVSMVSLAVSTREHSDLLILSAMGIKANAICLWYTARRTKIVFVTARIV